MENKSAWIRWLPGLLTFGQYKVTWLVHDVVAGVVLVTMLVPVGIAYAVASGLPGICGLFIVPLLAYALFGPSRVLVLGPDSSLAAVILGVVFPLSGGDPGRAVALAGMMAVVSGIVCILAGVARLGFVTELLSKPIRYGYMNGIALTVLISQLPKFRLLGRGRRPVARIVGHWQPGCGWKVKLGCVCDRRRHTGGSSASQEKHTLSGSTCCCSLRDGDRCFVGP
jgi:MFS superfamily sulfate permease-like transporter